MNKFQKDYVAKKSAYEAAFKKEDWDLVDALEDPMLEAEFALVDWMFDECIKTGKYSKEDAEFMRRNSDLDQWKKFVGWALKLKVA